MILLPDTCLTMQAELAILQNWLAQPQPESFLFSGRMYKKIPLGSISLTLYNRQEGFINMSTTQALMPVHIEGLVHPFGNPVTRVPSRDEALGLVLDHIPSAFKVEDARVVTLQNFNFGAAVRIGLSGLLSDSLAEAAFSYRVLSEIHYLSNPPGLRNFDCTPAIQDRLRAGTMPAGWIDPAVIQDKPWMTG